MSGRYRSSVKDNDVDKQYYFAYAIGQSCFNFLRCNRIVCVLGLG